MTNYQLPMTNYQLQIKSFVFGPFETNCYVVTINDQSPMTNDQSPMVLLIDPACAYESEQQQLLTYIENHKFEIINHKSPITNHQLPITIVATHGHLDHLWGAAWACQQWQTPVLMHEADIPMAQAMQAQYDLFGIPATPAPFPIKPLPTHQSPGASSRQTGDVRDRSAEKGYYQSPITNPQSPIPLFRGEQGGRILSTPGHTPGSVCFYFPEDGILFSGDTLFKMGYGRTDLPGGNYSQLMDSLDLLLALPPETVVYPGHGAPTTIAAELTLI